MDNPLEYDNIQGDHDTVPDKETGPLQTPNKTSQTERKLSDKSSGQQMHQRRSTPMKNPVPHKIRSPSNSSRQKKSLLDKQQEGKTSNAKIIEEAEPIAEALAKEEEQSGIKKYRKSNCKMNDIVIEELEDNQENYNSQTTKKLDVIIQIQNLENEQQNMEIKSQECCDIQNIDSKNLKYLEIGKKNFLENEREDETSSQSSEEIDNISGKEENSKNKIVRKQHITIVKKYSADEKIKDKEIKCQRLQGINLSDNSINEDFSEKEEQTCIKKNQEKNVIQECIQLPNQISQNQSMISNKNSLKTKVKFSQRSIEDVINSNEQKLVQFQNEIKELDSKNSMKKFQNIQKVTNNQKNKEIENPEECEPQIVYRSVKNSKNNQNLKPKWKTCF